MRSLLFILAIALSAVLLGCQDNTLTGPASSQPSLAGQLAKTPTPNGVIPYHVILRDPTQQPNGWIEIEGVIRYSLTQEPIMRETRVSLNGTNNAKLWSVDEIQKIWTISCKSSHSCCVPNGGMGDITCTFPIEGRTDGLKLCAHVHVSAERMEVDYMWLELPHATETTVN